MTNPANDIVRQASQGSVAAIIQVLNEKLADSGIRTRAIFAEGVLQLLCEAPTLDQLDQSILVERIRHILESIAPRNIRRVNINSRIVREQQLLWLEEINRDPAGQVLWSKEITLKKPNFFQQLLKDRKDRQYDATKIIATKKPSRRVQDRRLYWRGLAGGASLTLLLVVGWVAYSRMNLSPKQESQPDRASSSQASPPQNTPVTTPAITSPNPSSATNSQDAFAAAVRLAEQASRSGKEAKSSAAWLELAARWQQASDLMASVPPSDKRYETAQDRVATYRKNSESALMEAKRQQSELSTSAPSEPQPSDSPSVLQ